MFFMVIPFITVTPSMLIKFFHTVCCSSSGGNGDLFNAHFSFCAFKHCNKKAISLIFYTSSKAMVTCRKMYSFYPILYLVAWKCLYIYPANTTIVLIIVCKIVDNVKHHRRFELMSAETTPYQIPIHCCYCKVAPAID